MAALPLPRPEALTAQAERLGARAAAAAALGERDKPRSSGGRALATTTTFIH
jgi:hypothetical protein